ncbi:MAG TPA: nuclease-related domain-containing protein [Solirubrobacteraceae bacterium]|jgi:hypothetical protein|nr:nuclease-related domain-containing protein [Solirubrobacteraceae bacterium]
MARHRPTGGRGPSAADPERIVAASLARHCPSVIVLHDRVPDPESQGIDHIAVAPSGVHVIDTRRRTGRIAVTRPLFGEARLRIDGRDRTAVLERLRAQVQAVADAVAEVDDAVPVQGALCFVNPTRRLVEGAPPLTRTLNVCGFPLLAPRALARQLRRGGPLSEARMAAIAAVLERRFRPA